MLSRQPNINIAEGYAWTSSWRLKTNWAGVYCTMCVLVSGSVCSQRAYFNDLIVAVLCACYTLRLCVRVLHFVCGCMLFVRACCVCVCVCLTEMEIIY